MNPPSPTPAKGLSCPECQGVKFVVTDTTHPRLEYAFARVRGLPLATDKVLETKSSYTLDLEM
jgi:hypothetical protein